MPEPTMPTTKPLTLIVATTSKRGIGQNGALPWPMLKGEMGYFARVTKRVPSEDTTTSGTEKMNAVIMGRKTWDSIPHKFRPLQGRANVVISRSLKLAEEDATKTGTTADVVGSLQEALALVNRRQDIARLFVIGGASIYEEALRHRDTKSVLLTKILQPDFECDTFFPADLQTDPEDSQDTDGGAVWKQKSQEELQVYTGEDFGEEGVKRTEKDVDYEFCLFEKRAIEARSVLQTAED